MGYPAHRCLGESTFKTIIRHVSIAVPVLVMHPYATAGIVLRYLTLHHSGSLSDPILEDFERQLLPPPTFSPWFSPWSLRARDYSARGTPCPERSAIIPNTPCETPRYLEPC